MKTLLQSIAVLLFFVLVTACEDNMSKELPIQQDNAITVTAYADGAAQTKTGIIDKTGGGKAVVWKSGNSISLFVNSGNNGGTQLTTTANGPVAEFTGSGTISSGSNNYWGLYPYNSTASCDGSSITTTLPATQLAYQGDVADNLLVTVGRSNNLTLYFKNACTIIGFTLSQENISKVTFSGRNNEYVAGEFTVSMDGSNNLVVTPTANAVKTIEITPAESSTFATGTTYYFAFLPQSFESGYTLTFTRNDDKIATYERTTAFNFAISTFYTMTNKDSGLFQPNNEIWYTTTTERPLTLGPQTVEGLVSNTYVDGRGTMVFENDVTVIPQYLFEYDLATGTTLTSVSLPPTVQRIECMAFRDVRITELEIPKGCICEPGAFHLIPDLARMIGDNVSEDGRLLVQNNVVIRFANHGVSNYVIPEGITAIGRGAFSGCQSLSEISIPYTVEELGAGAFINCNLTSLELPSRISIIPSSCFDGNPITQLSLPASLERIESYAFTFTHLKHLTIPALVTYIGEGCLFASSNEIMDVKVLASTPPTLIQENTFGKYSVFVDEYTIDDQGSRIYVPSSSVSLYKADPMWKKYDIVSIDFWPWGEDN